MVVTHVDPVVLRCVKTASALLQGIELTPQSVTKTGPFARVGIECSIAFLVLILPTGCKKGGRECIYPESSTSAKASRSASSGAVIQSSQNSPGSSSDEFGDEDATQERLEAIPDEDEASNDFARSNSLSKYGLQQSNASHFMSGQKVTTRYDSETPSLVQDKGASPTPSTEGSIGYTAHDAIALSRHKRTRLPMPSSNTDALRTDWSHLSLDLQFYLTYFYENITHLHYSLKFDSGNFLRTTFLDAALRNESLLFAVVGFSAFQRTLHTSRGKMQDFLQ